MRKTSGFHGAGTACASRSLFRLGLQPDADPRCHRRDRRRAARCSALLGATAVVALAVIVALAGVDMAICLVILMLAPIITVVGYEMAGYRHQADALAP
jgi:uncharacterized membrane protein YdbT with pleckstrin-like domain